MPLTRNQVQIGAVILECAPFEWPRNFWDVLELNVTEETGWRDLTDAVRATLQGYYNGARGRVDEGMQGAIVQYVEGTGGASAIQTVTDWRGNSGTFAFVPNDGLELHAIPGAVAGGIAHHTARIRMVRLA